MGFWFGVTGFNFPRFRKIQMLFYVKILIGPAPWKIPLKMVSYLSDNSDLSKAGSKL